MRVSSLSMVAILGLAFGLAGCSSDDESKSVESAGPAKPYVPKTPFNDTTRDRESEGQSGGWSVVGGGSSTNDTDWKDLCVPIHLSTIVVTDDDVLGEPPFVLFAPDVAPNTSGPAPERLMLMLHNFENGDFDLASEVNSAPDACEQCVFAIMDKNAEGLPNTFFFQHSGAVHIGTESDIENRLIKATIEDAFLVQYTRTATGIVPSSGRCWKIESETITVLPVVDWTCHPADFSNGYCDCDCGVWDPDCDSPGLEIGGCVEGQTCEKDENDLPYCDGVPSVPTEWTCDEEKYADGESCDCNCGVWDPDCADGALQKTGCNPGFLCKNDEPDCVPVSWTCSAAYYGDAICQCDCGAWDDEDCESETPVWGHGCDSGQVCVSPGVCAGTPDAWACLPEKFDDATECNCGCGAWDPDCDGDLPNDCGAGGLICSSETLKCVPEVWTCDDEDFGDGTCGCGCGSWDSDCTTANPGKCVELGERCSVANDVCIPEDWVCDDADYEDGEICNCGCGAPDPDCDGMLDDDCSVGSACSLDTYECIPEHWSCEPEKYGNGNCDCGCGIPDPECTATNPGNCDPGERCSVAENACIPEDWSCGDEKYEDGTCECKCTVWDPDCDDTPNEPSDCETGETCADNGGGPVCE